MKIKITTIRGLAFDLVIEEAVAIDLSGGTLFYVATIYRQDKASRERQVVRRSRLPETADIIRRDVQRDGIRALRRFTA